MGRGGTYSFVKDGMIFHGELARCEASSAVELACAWEDELRAAGKATFTFDEDQPRLLRAVVGGR